MANIQKSTKKPDYVIFSRQLSDRPEKELLKVPLYVLQETHAPRLWETRINYLEMCQPITNLSAPLQTDPELTRIVREEFVAYAPRLAVNNSDLSSAKLFLKDPIGAALSYTILEKGSGSLIPPLEHQVQPDYIHPTVSLRAYLSYLGLPNYDRLLEEVLGNGQLKSFLLDRRNTRIALTKNPAPGRKFAQCVSRTTATRAYLLSEVNDWLRQNFPNRFSI